MFTHYWKMNRIETTSEIWKKSRHTCSVVKIWPATGRRRTTYFGIDCTERKYPKAPS